MDSSNPAKTPAPPVLANSWRRPALRATGPNGWDVLRPNPALLSMGITTIVIRNARRVAEPEPDQNEELVVELAPVRDIPAMIRDGRIDHAVCVAGLLWWLSLDNVR